MEKQKKKNNRTKVSWNTWSNGINVCRYCLKVISNRLEGNGRYCFVWDLDSTHSSYGISIQMLIIFATTRDFTILSVKLSKQHWKCWVCTGRLEDIMKMYWYGSNLWKRNFSNKKKNLWKGMILWRATKLKKKYEMMFFMVIQISLLIMI